MKTSKILIVDFGSQFTKLIARRIREAAVYCEIVPFNKALAYISAFKPQGIILSGGPASVNEHESPSIEKEIFNLNIPILGICYGQQLICQLLGGKVVGSNHREYGRSTLSIVQNSALFGKFWHLYSKHDVWMSHGDRVEAIPAGFEAVAVTEGAPYAAIANESKIIYGLQFHPEVMHTSNGTDLLKNFVINICKCEPNWTMHNFLEQKIKEIKEQIGNEKVICAVSGGVDSTVVAALLNRAISSNLECFFVNTGLLRKNEHDEAYNNLRDTLKINVKYVDASSRFLNALKGVEDPEQKRKIIGKLFIDVFEEEASKVGDAKFLAQGTLYSDVVESSVTGVGATIKSHHNVGGLPERMQLKLVEPLREIFKDEVRELARELNIPDHMLMRHPFPGPGLAIRIIGDITQEKINLLQDADDIYISELKKAGLYDKIWQAFSVLLPIKTVGVMGDGRTYDNVLALRAVTSFDGMTAEYYPFEHKFLSHVSNQITNKVKGINRVVYDISSKPPATIEWE